ncbi:MAG: YdcH family protein [Acidobacteriota bacterium]
MSAQTDLKEELLKTDEEFRSLFDEHQQCERRLDRLQQTPDYTLDDELEAKKIKVHKLALKDRMYEIMRQHRPAVAASA